jgi:hypothetical protein
MIGAGRVLRRLGGGSGAEPWQPITATPAALVDPGGLLDVVGGTSFVAGRLTAVFDTHTTDVDGYQEALARWTIPVLTLWPDFDSDQDVIDLGWDLITWPRGTLAQQGLWCGILDSTTVDGSLAGAGLALKVVSGGTDQIGRLGPSSIPSLNNLGLISGAQASIRFADDGTNYPSQIICHGQIEGTSRWDDAVSGPAEVLRAPVSNWVVAFGAWHDGTSDTAGITIIADLYARRRRVPRPFP